MTINNSKCAYVCMVPFNEVVAHPEFISTQCSGKTRKKCFCENVIIIFIVHLTGFPLSKASIKKAWTKITTAMFFLFFDREKENKTELSLFLEKKKSDHVLINHRRTFKTSKIFCCGIFSNRRLIQLSILHLLTSPVRLVTSLRDLNSPFIYPPRSFNLRDSVPWYWLKITSAACAMSATPGASTFPECSSATTRFAAPAWRPWPHSRVACWASGARCAAKFPVCARVSRWRRRCGSTTSYGNT